MNAFTGRRAGLLITAATLVAACSVGSGREPASSPPSVAPSMGTGLAVPSASPSLLAEGPVTAGTYLVQPPQAGWAECAPNSDCPPEPPHARSLHVEVTVPPGWQAMFEGTVIAPQDPGSTEGPTGAGLAIGWTSPTAGLHSEPCLPAPHLTPDLPVGPTVDAFVDAVLAHPALQVTDPVAVELGGYRGRFLTLTAPSDISGCRDWRPWEPGIAAQGPDNNWDTWVIDVDGLRMFVVTEEFPGTPAAVRAELRAMAESIRFLP